MSQVTLRGGVEPTLDGALDRFERVESELEEAEERRRMLAHEAARAASDLESVLTESIGKAIATRDRLEEELAVVIDHLSRLEAVRSRSSRTTTPVVIDAVRDPGTASIELGGDVGVDGEHQ